MIRTTHSCYLYGPYDSHNTQLLFIWAVWFAQHTAVILWAVWFAQHTAVIYMGRMIRPTHSCYLYGPYDSHNKQLLFMWAVWFAQHTAVIYMGRMIRTTHSCYLYGPYDSHNTQLLFYGSCDSHNTHTLAPHVIIRFVSVTRRSDFLQDQNILRSTICSLKMIIEIFT